jgi:hypothetical protein
LGKCAVVGARHNRRRINHRTNRCRANKRTQGHEKHGKDNESKPADHHKLFLMGPNEFSVLYSKHTQRSTFHTLPKVTVHHGLATH